MFLIDLKTERAEACLTLKGNLLHIFEAEKENALLPLSFSLVLGTISSNQSVELRGWG